MILKLGLVAAIAIASCVPTNNEIAADASAQTSAVEAQAQAELAGIKEAWNAATSAMIAKWNARIIYPVCDARVPQGNDCGMLSDKYSDARFQKTFAEQRCAGISAADRGDSCSHLLSTDFILALNTRYGFLPNDQCATSDCSSFFKMELTLLNAFNAQVSEQAHNEAAAIDAKYGAMAEAVIARFKSQTDQINRDASQRFEDARRQRAALLAIGNGLQAGGSALANPPPAAPMPQPSPAPPAVGCSNDYECGFGKLCAKDSGAIQGACVRTVTPYGTPTFQGPNPASMGVGTGNCAFDTDCSVGFKCVKNSGGLRGNCIK